jgi:uncharacterized protein YpiB (UPF0302 family)
MNIMRPTPLFSEEEQQKGPATYPIPKSNKDNKEITPSMTTKETANLISDTLLQYVDRALQNHTPAHQSKPIAP